MSLHKGIERGKEHRQPYRHGASVSRACRHGGNCPWCQQNRTIQTTRMRIALRDHLRDSTGTDEE